MNMTGCKCSACVARQGNPSHPEHAAVYLPCFCGHNSRGRWQSSPSCPYHGVATARRIDLIEAERA